MPFINSASSAANQPIGQSTYGLSQSLCGRACICDECGALTASCSGPLPRENALDRRRAACHTRRVRTSGIGGFISQLRAVVYLAAAMVVFLALGSFLRGSAEQAAEQQRLINELEQRGAQFDELPDGWHVLQTTSIVDDSLRLVVTLTDDPDLRFAFACVTERMAEPPGACAQPQREGRPDRPEYVAAGQAADIVFTCQETETWCDVDFLAEMARQLGEF